MNITSKENLRSNINPQCLQFLAINIGLVLIHQRYILQHGQKPSPGRLRGSRMKNAYELQSTGKKKKSYKKIVKETY